MVKKLGNGRKTILLVRLMANIIVPLIVVSAAALPIYSAIYYNKYIDIKGSKKDIEGRQVVLSTVFMCSIAVLFFFMFMNNTIMVTIQNWFFDGIIFNHEVLTEPDEGGEPYYETQFYFKFLTKPHINIIGAFNLLFLFLFVGSPFICYYFSSQFTSINEGENDDYIDNRAITFLSIVRVVMGISLVLCLLDMPYIYYTIIRFLIPMGCIYLANSQHKKSSFTGWIFYVTIAILFNPLSPIELTRLLWKSIDIGLAVILFGGAIKSYIDSKY